MANSNGPFECHRSDWLGSSFCLRWLVGIQNLAWSRGTVCYSLFAGSLISKPRIFFRTSSRNNTLSANQNEKQNKILLRYVLKMGRFDYCVTATRVLLADTKLLVATTKRVVAANLKKLSQISLFAKHLFSASDTIVAISMVLSYPQSSYLTSKTSSITTICQQDRTQYLILTHYRPAMPLGSREFYLRECFQFSIVTI